MRANLGLHGIGLSVGGHGVHVGMNRRGMYNSAGLPGSGLYGVNYMHSRESGQHRMTGSGGIGWFWAFMIAEAFWWFVFVQS